MIDMKPESRKAIFGLPVFASCSWFDRHARRRSRRAVEELQEAGSVTPRDVLSTPGEALGTQEMGTAGCKHVSKTIEAQILRSYCFQLFQAASGPPGDQANGS
jgi:hypothetical protein